MNYSVSNRVILFLAIKAMLFIKFTEVNAKESTLVNLDGLKIAFR